MTLAGPGLTPQELRRRRRPARTRARLLRLLVVLAAFGAGVALGQALHDNPKPGGTRRYVRTLEPATLRATVTVTATGP